MPMRKVVSTGIVGLHALFAVACGEGATGSESAPAVERRSDSFLDDYLASRDTGNAPVTLPIDGEWFGVAFCPSGPYPVTLTVSGAQATGSILPAVGDARRTTPFHLDHLERRGTVAYAADSQTLLFEAPPEPDADPRQARGLFVQLLLAPPAPDVALMVVSETSAGRPRSCSEGLAGRGDAGAIVRTFAERLETIRSDRRAVQQQACPAAWASWLREAMREGPNALRTPAFESAFGAPLLELPAEALLAASAILTGSCLETIDRSDRIAATRASALLRDYRAYQQAFLDLQRDRVARGWRDWADERLAQGAVATRGTATALRGTPLEFGLAQHPALAGFDAQIAARGDALEAEQQNETFVRRIEAHREDFRTLLDIAMQAESRGDVDLALIATGLDYYLADAAQAYASDVTEPADAAFLAAWAGQQRAGRCPARSAATCADAAEAIEDRLDDLAEAFAETEEAAFESVADRTDGLDRLAAMVARERDLRRRYGVLAAHAAFRDGIEDRRALRREAQAAHADTLLARLAGARTSPAMRSIEADHFLDDDIDASPALLAELDERLAATRPFSGLPAAAYLNALYNHDFQQLRALDRDYLAGITPLMQFAVQQVSAYGPLMDAMTGRRRGASAEELQRGLLNMTALPAAIGTYLVDYQDAYAECLRPDATQFTITRRTDIVTVDGFGNTLARREGWTNRDDYRVNSEFAGQFRALFDAATGSAQAQLFDLFLNDARIGTLRNGVRRSMSDFACESPEIRQLERGMLAYDAEVRRRARQR